MTLSLDLPFPPSVNRIWRQFQGRTILSKEGRAYRAEVVAAIYAARVQGFGRQNIRLVVAAHMPDDRRRDLDNLCKAPLDGLVKAGVMADDSQVVDLRIYRAGLDRQNPRITVWLEAA